MRSPLAALHGLPFTVQIPALAALLVIIISTLISERVLNHLEQSQKRYLETLGSTYLGGLSNTLIPAVQRQDIWEVYDAVARAHRLYVAIRPLSTVVTDPEGIIIASSDPLELPPLGRPPKAFLERFKGERLVIDETRARALLRRDIHWQNRTLGSIYSSFDISTQIRERRRVLNTLIVTNGGIALLLALVGYWALRKMLQPVRTLADHLRAGATHSATRIPEGEFPSRGSEMTRLFEGYNALVDAETERRRLITTLHEEERMASLGRLASGMAHEINNPLGGMFNALDALEQYGESESVKNTSINLLKRGLSNIHDVVKSTLATYRSSGESTPLTRNDLEDLRILIKPTLRRDHLTLNWRNELSGQFPVQRSQVRQISLNLLLNACIASPPGGSVCFTAETRGDTLGIEISDDGPGMPAEIMDYLATGDGANSPPRKSSGLGLWIVRRLLEELHGEIRVENLQPRGARIRVSFHARPERLQRVA